MTRRLNYPPQSDLSISLMLRLQLYDKLLKGRAADVITVAKCHISHVVDFSLWHVVIGEN